MSFRVKFPNHGSLYQHSGSLCGPSAVIKEVGQMALPNNNKARKVSKGAAGRRWCSRGGKEARKGGGCNNSECNLYIHETVKEQVQ